MKKYLKIISLLLVAMLIIVSVKDVFAIDIGTDDIQQAEIKNDEMTQAEVNTSDMVNEQGNDLTKQTEAATSSDVTKRSLEIPGIRATSNQITGFSFDSVFTNQTSGNLNDTAVGDIIQRTVTMKNTSDLTIGVSLNMSIESVASTQASIPTVREIGEETMSTNFNSMELQSSYSFRNFKLLPGDTITLIQDFEIISPSGIQIGQTQNVSSLSNNYQLYAFTFNNDELEINDTGFYNVIASDNLNQTASYAVRTAAPKLTVKKSVTNLSGEDFHVGDFLEYKIKVTNSVSRSILTNGVVSDTLDQFLDSPTNIKITYSDGTVETIPTNAAYDGQLHKLNVPLTKRLVGKDDVTVSFETKILDGATGKSITNTAFADGTGLLGGYTSADFIFDTAQGTWLNSETLVDGSISEALPTVSDNLSLIPADSGTQTQPNTSDSKPSTSEVTNKKLKNKILPSTGGGIEITYIFIGLILIVTVFRYNKYKN